MNPNEQLKIWVYEALSSVRSPMTVVEVAKFIWDHHENDLRDLGDLFYTWQYSMRWEAQKLREEGKLTFAGRRWALK